MSNKREKKGLLTKLFGAKEKGGCNLEIVEESDTNFCCADSKQRPDDADLRSDVDIRKAAGDKR